MTRPRNITNPFLQWKILNFIANHRHFIRYKLYDHEDETKNEHYYHLYGDRFVITASLCEDKTKDDNSTDVYEYNLECVDLTSCHNCTCPFHLPVSEKVSNPLNASKIQQHINRSKFAYRVYEKMLKSYRENIFHKTTLCPGK